MCGIGVYKYIQKKEYAVYVIHEAVEKNAPYRQIIQKTYAYGKIEYSI